MSNWHQWWHPSGPFPSELAGCDPPLCVKCLRHIEPPYYITDGMSDDGILVGFIHRQLLRTTARDQDHYIDQCPTAAGMHSNADMGLRPQGAQPDPAQFACERPKTATVMQCGGKPLGFYQVAVVSFEESSTADAAALNRLGRAVGSALAAEWGGGYEVRSWAPTDDTGKELITP